ncbi:MAG: mannose-1-phosphate guanylyltransferase [Bacteroidetes bacterium]|nr:mannose-1-phosphate guanylyltransferase [Bacteroidota bacterium]
MIKNKNNYAIIMAGGVGSRFWPASRSHYPKQFIDILGVGKSLLQQTYERFLESFLPENIFIITNSSYVGLVKEQLPNMPDSCILGEPTAKNTAACIAYTCAKIYKINTHAICIVAPSDHLILDSKKFLDYVELGMSYAQKNHALVTLGIRPSRPDTGYGYIQFLENEPILGIHKVKTFTEKPSLEIAKMFVETGEFLWNAGIFIWGVSSIRKAFKQYLPEQYDLFDAKLESLNTPDEAEVVRKFYEECKSISIDYGIMEKADNVFVIPSEFGWSDLGTWTSLFDISSKDESNNAIQGKNIFTYEVENSLINKSRTEDGKVIVVKGINNLIIVDTPDALIICDKDREQEVKQIVTDLKIKFNDKYT